MTAIPPSSVAPESIGAIFERFVAGFNDNDLDAVMASLAEGGPPSLVREHR